MVDFFFCQLDSKLIYMLEEEILVEKASIRLASSQGCEKWS